MAANKFVLVPEDIYKGLTSTDTGNLNLDFVKRSLDNVKKEKTNPSIKYTNYNQELRRYLFLKKKHDDTPVKVEIFKKPSPAIAEELETDDGMRSISTRSPSVSSLNPETENSVLEDNRSITTGADSEYDTAADTDEEVGTPKSVVNLTNIEERCAQLVNLLKSNPEKFGVREDGKILNERGKPVQNSSIENSVRWIIKYKMGDKPAGKKPSGTKYIEEIVDKDPLLKVYTTPVKRKIKEEPETPKTFQPKLWM